MKNILLIGGTYDRSGGKPSSYVNKLYTSLQKHDKDNLYLLFNGGEYERLTTLIEEIEKGFYTSDAIIWMPNIPNSEPKLINRIKQALPHCLFVSSKRNDDNKYTFKHLIGRALTSKSNLFIEFKVKDKVTASLFDPLGNCYLKDSNSIEKLANCLSSRMKFMFSLTRLPSVSISEETKLPEENDEIKRFLQYARNHSDTFHKIIHANSENERFVGNLSFRCAHGFPSFKKDDLIYVSKRNVDKRDIQLDSFVPVEPDIVNAVRYHGKNKPSVDTPIQVELYGFFKGAKWMMHSHVYIKDAPFTEHVVPCGCFDEVFEIINCYSKEELFYSMSNSGFICINLKGHGSLVVSKDVDVFDEKLTERYVSRNMPEMQGE